VAEVIEILSAAGSACDELRVAGGGARLDALGAIKADVLGVPVAHLEADTAATGAALLAAEAAGYGEEAIRAIDAAVARARGFEPESRAAEPLRVRREWFAEVRASSAVRVAGRAGEAVLP
jgi:sugar (pentulose or hexulose) kinase